MKTPIGLALSGGGFRAVAFHLGCLRALNDLGILRQVNTLSTISGGSVIGAYYAYNPHLGFAEFEGDIRQILRSGLQRKLFTEVSKISNLYSSLSNAGITGLEGVLCGLFGTKPKILRFPASSDMLVNVLNRELFPNQRMDSPRREDLEVIIGSCELRTGTAFRFGSSSAGCWRLGSLVRWNVDLAVAVAASAAYQVLLPPLHRRWEFENQNDLSFESISLADGGIYDNLGVQVLEPGRSIGPSVHTCDCEYILACDAGAGHSAVRRSSFGALPRVMRSFEIIFQRNHDATVHRLHQLKESGKIKGFLLPYLGQLDEKLAVLPNNFEGRESVSGYPTNFAAMSEDWIERLSARGEALTRALAIEHVPELIK